jgi:hypothetical protein
MDEDGNVQDRVGIKNAKTDAIIRNQTMKEGMNRNGKATEK